MSNTVDESRAALLAHLIAAGYARCEPELLQPAKVFLDLSGEDIRGRLFLTSDALGVEYCLRPEFTIPVCLQWLGSKQAGAPTGFCYLGPVFRQRPGQSPQFLQAGLESFGRVDHAAADAEILALSLEAAAAAGRGGLHVRTGDAGLFSAMLVSLDLSDAWCRRILRGHARGQSLDEIVAAPLDRGAQDHSGVLAALSGADKAGARALVEDLLSIAGFHSVGGRSAGEIAERFLEQASLRAGGGFPADKLAVLRRFMAIEGDLDHSLEQLRALAQEAGLGLAAPLQDFDDRIGFLAAHGVDLAALKFSASFARNLDYYTGFVFEARDPARPGQRPIIGGGRYDRLIASLNGGSDVPAVGAAIWIDRLLEPAI